MIVYRTVRRTWRERLFSLPWRPLVATTQVSEILPDPPVQRERRRPRPAPAPRSGGLAEPWRGSAPVYSRSDDPATQLLLMGMYAQPPAVRDPDPEPFRSGGGGDFGGAGASASWGSSDSCSSSSSYDSSSSWSCDSGSSSSSSD